MTRRDGAAGCAGPMVLVDLETESEALVSQPLAGASTACRAARQDFACARAVLRRASDEAPDRVICNRFGGLVAQGDGSRAEWLAILA
jgi:hypothetical protein